MNDIGGCCTASKNLYLPLLFLLSASLLASAFLPHAALAKRVPMGHPSLLTSLDLGPDPRFDFIVMDNEATVDALKADIDDKMYGIFDTLILPEIRKSFDERKAILSDSYVEDVSGYLDLNDSMLDILISKVPPDYDCNTESCAHKFVQVELPADLELSHLRRIIFSIAVYENMGSGREYDQMADRIIAKASAEAEVLFSEAANVLEDNKASLLEDGTAIERILLRQYEDISRVSVLFLQSEPGTSDKKPLDVVITSNSYYERSWSYLLSEQSEEEPPTPEMLQECEEAGIDEAECSEIAVLQARRHQLPTDGDAAEQEDETTNSIALIGIGAAGAGIVAIVALRKLR